MTLLRNDFKHRLLAGESQVGLWCTLPGGFVAEVLAGAGFDWVMYDTEHSPSDPTDVIAQLQAAAAYPASALVRPAWNDAVLIKRLLDAGAQTILVPFVQTAEEAEAAVRAVRYPPRGVRGVSGVSRATRWGRIEGYAERADEEICLLVQVETTEAVGRIEEIAAVDGIDGLFVGPSDLAASMGMIGRAGHPDVAAAVLEAIRRITAAGKPAGVLTLDPAFARRCIEAGSTFTGVGLDASLLAGAADALASSFRS